MLQPAQRYDLVPLSLPRLAETRASYRWVSGTRGSSVSHGAAAGRLCNRCLSILKGPPAPPQSTACGGHELDGGWTARGGWADHAHLPPPLRLQRDE